MILCVTLNPCLDKTLTVPAWAPGDNVRGLAVREVVGGKGNNVARALTRLGQSARPVTFLGGPVGNRCQALLRDQDQFDALIVDSAAPTREILTVLTEGTTDQSAFFDPDPLISAEEAGLLLERVKQAIQSGQVQALTLSGSSPSPATHSSYADLISLARSAGVPVLLDTYGPPLKRIGPTWPDVIQLNRREAGVYLGTPNPDEPDVWEMLDRWIALGVKLAVVTDGPDQVLACSGPDRFRAVPPTITLVNPIGSGDSFLAGMTDAWVRGLDPESVLRRGVASASANAAVWDAGAIERAEVDRLAGLVVVERA